MSDNQEVENQPGLSVARLNIGRDNIGNETRRLIIHAIDHMGKTVAEAASLFKVNPSTVSSIKRTFYTEGGRIDKKPAGGNRRQILSEEHKRQILDWVDNCCTTSLAVLAQKCSENFGIRPSESTVSRALRSFHYTIKRVCLQPERRNTQDVIDQRQAYCSEFLEIMSRRESIFFIDESGFSCSMRSSYGRAVRGHPAVVRVPAIRTKNFSVCAAIGFDSVLCFEVKDRPYNAGLFLEFIEQIIEKLHISQLVNAVLIMDNVPFHHASSVRLAIENAGHILKFLPPYSPFLNPIENAFNQWKSGVKQSLPTNNAELLSAINTSASVISGDNCRNYYRHMETYIPRCLRSEVIED